MTLEIFLPFWGDPALLREAVESVLAQDSPNWELTVVDDCYPDETVPEYFAALEDPRVRYVRNETNQGITENYRTCLSMATAELVVLMGCDDVMHPNYVSLIQQAHKDHPEAAIIQPGVQVIDETGAVVKSLADSVKDRIAAPRTDSPVLLSGEDLAVSLLRGNWLYWPSLAFKRESIMEVEFRDGLPIVQDLALVIDMALRDECLLYVPTLAFSYRRHSASASAATLLDGSRFRGDREYAAIARQLTLEKGWPKAARAARTRWLSRAHALSLLPQAAATRSTSALKTVIRHAFGA